MDILTLQLEYQKARKSFVVAIVVEVLGSSSAKPGTKALFDNKGALVFGWIGGGCAQSMVAEQACNCLISGEPSMVDVDLTDEIFGAGMPCGGSMRVYVEPVLPKPVLWITGDGLIAETLCGLADRMGFEVIVHDHQATVSGFPAARRIINNDHNHYQELSPSKGDFVVVASHHKGDYFSLTRAIQSEAGYIALIASRKRSQLIMDRLAKEGVDKEVLGRIHAPAGLAIGAKTPEEIALSVISEMIMLRRGGQGGSLSQKIS